MDRSIAGKQRGVKPLISIAKIQEFACVNVCRLDCRLTHVGEQIGDGLNVSPSVHITQLVDHRQTQCMYPNSSLSFRDTRLNNHPAVGHFVRFTYFEPLRTFTGGVEQSRLEAGQRRVCQRVLDWHLDSKGRVWVDVSQGQQVSRAHEEVTVERMDGQTWGRSEPNARAYISPWPVSQLKQNWSPLVHRILMTASKPIFLVR